LEKLWVWHGESVYRYYNFYFCFIWVENFISHLREENRLTVFGNKVLRRIFEPKTEEVTVLRRIFEPETEKVTGWRKLHNEELYDLYSSPYYQGD
jgi:hypothetical protein